MNRKDELIDALTRSFDGDAWHGPALEEVLADVTAEEAMWRPAQHVHSIWEITLHVAGWANEVASRLTGAAPKEPEGGDWRERGTADNDGWEDAIQQVFSARDTLMAVVRQQSDEELDAPAQTPGGPAFSRFGLVLGVIQHNIYHAGQIALLKKQIRAVV